MREARNNDSCDALQVSSAQRDQLQVALSSKWSAFPSLLMLLWLSLLMYNQQLQLESRLLNLTHMASYSQVPMSFSWSLPHEHIMEHTPLWIKTWAKSLSMCQYQYPSLPFSSHLLRPIVQQPHCCNITILTSSSLESHIFPENKFRNFISSVWHQPFPPSQTCMPIPYWKRRLSLPPLQSSLVLVISLLSIGHISKGCLRLGHHEPDIHCCESPAILKAMMEGSPER